MFKTPAILKALREIAGLFAFLKLIKTSPDGCTTGYVLQLSDALRHVIVERGMLAAEALAQHLYGSS